MGFLGKLFGSKEKDSDIYTMRSGRLVKTDERHKAFLSNDFNCMLRQLHKNGDPIDTHFLYLQTSKHAYSKRKDEKMRKLFKKIASEHVDMFDSLVEPLRKEIGILPHVPTFQYLATVYTEDGEYEKAIEVCEKAMKFGLRDGTKGGFPMRIERIKKKMKSHENG